MKFIGDQIAIGNIPVTELAAEYGTPTYVYDEQKIRANYRRAYQAFAKHYPDFKMFYAVKCCNNPAIVNIMRQEGAGADCASVNEILLAKSVGLSGENVMFSGNFLSDSDIRQGLESGVIFNLDDISILPRLLKFGTPEMLSFRVNPGYGKSNVGEYVTNAGPGAKFGIHPDQVMDAYRMAKAAGIKRFGAHMMTGSCITDADYFPFVTGLLMDIIGKVAKELQIDFEFIDLGGGLGIPYKPGEPALDLEKAAEKTAEVFRKNSRVRNETTSAENGASPLLCGKCRIPDRHRAFNKGFLQQNYWNRYWNECSGASGHVRILSSHLCQWQGKPSENKTGTLRTAV